MPTFTILGFVAHLAEMAAAVHEEAHYSLEKAAKVVEAEAKRELGHYQESAGPFAGWAELADSTKDERAQQGFTENDPGLRSGEMRDSIAHKVVSNTEALVYSDDQNLVYFELGTTRQPPRSVLGIAAVHKVGKVQEILGTGVLMSLVGEGVHGGKMGAAET